MYAENYFLMGYVIGVLAMAVVGIILLIADELDTRKIKRIAKETYDNYSSKNTRKGKR